MEYQDREPIDITDDVAEAILAGLIGREIRAQDLETTQTEDMCVFTASGEMAVVLVRVDIGLTREEVNAMVARQAEKEDK